MDNKKITVGFTLIDRCGDTYENLSTCGVGDDIRTDLEVIGDQFDAFLKQCGYVRTGYYMLMDSLTDDEYHVVSDCLNRYRNNHTN